MAMAYMANMTQAKMGSARMRLVTIRSILSDRVRLCLGAFFWTARRMTLSI